MASTQTSGDPPVHTLGQRGGQHPRAVPSSVTSSSRHTHRGPPGTWRQWPLPPSSLSVSVTVAWFKAQGRPLGFSRAGPGPHPRPPLPVPPTRSTRGRGRHALPAPAALTRGAVSVHRPDASRRWTPTAWSEGAAAARAQGPRARSARAAPSLIPGRRGGHSASGPPALGLRPHPSFPPHPPRRSRVSARRALPFLRWPSGRPRRLLREARAVLLGEVPLLSHAGEGARVRVQCASWNRPTPALPRPAGERTRTGVRGTRGNRVWQAFRGAAARQASIPPPPHVRPAGGSGFQSPASAGLLPWRHSSCVHRRPAPL